MCKSLIRKIHFLSWRETSIFGLILAVGIEIITIIFRFGLKMEATRDTSALAAWTFGLRIHHGYFGLLLLIISPFLSKGFWKNLCLIIGIGLFLSDMVHHFLVLWPICGSPEFDLIYSSK